MQKEKVMPEWLMIVDAVYVFCVIIAYHAINTHFEDDQWLLTIILTIPVMIGTWGTIPIILLNLLIIGSRIRQNKLVVISRLSADSQSTINTDKSSKNKETKKTQKADLEKSASVQKENNMDIF